MASDTMYEDMMSEESYDFDHCTNDDMREIDDLMKSPNLDEAFPDYFGAQIDGVPKMR